MILVDLYGHRIATALGVLVLAACAAPPRGSAPGTHAPPPPNRVDEPRESAGVTAGAPRRLALLVGVNDYQYDEDIGDLSGTHNDVEAIHNMLVRNFAFRPSDIEVLRDSEATPL